MIWVIGIAIVAYIAFKFSAVLNKDPNINDSPSNKKSELLEQPTNEAAFSIAGIRKLYFIGHIITKFYLVLLSTNVPVKNTLYIFCMGISFISIILIS